MARLDPQIKLRLPPALKQHILDASKVNGRSMNAEIVARLESTPFCQSDVPLTREDIRQIVAEEVRAALQPLLDELKGT